MLKKREAYTQTAGNTFSLSMPCPAFARDVTDGRMGA